MVTATIGKDKYRTEITANEKTFLSDEPGDMGGTNLAPAPPDYLLTALASCTAITLRMYADRKNLEVDRITVNVGHDKQEFKSVFTVAVSYEGKLDEAQQKRFLEIAKSCPVHKILTNPIQVETQWAV